MIPAPEHERHEFGQQGGLRPETVVYDAAAVSGAFADRGKACAVIASLSNEFERGLDQAPARPGASLVLAEPRCIPGNTFIIKYF